MFNFKFSNMKKIFFLGALLSAGVASFALPTAPAPEPTVAAEQVMSVYSDKYTPEAAWGFCEGWGQTTALENKTINEDNYLSYTNFNYLGWQVQGNPYNALLMEKLHIDVWADEAGKVNFYPIHGPNDKDDAKFATLTLEAGKWNSFDLDLATDFAGLSFTSIFQFKFGEGTISAFAVDNVYFYRATAMNDEEAPKDLTAEVVAADFLSISIKASATDNSGAVTYEVKAGDEVLASIGNTSGTESTILVEGLEPGTDYTFAVYAKDNAGNASAPVSLNASTMALPEAAPAPTLPATSVKALFSDAYEMITTFDTHCQNWWQAPAINIANFSDSDEAMYYYNFADGAAFGWVFNQVDVAGYQKLHISVYPLEAGVLTIYPVIAPEDDFKKATATLVANKWNEVVLDYTDKTFAPFAQLGWVITSGLKAFLVDNVYFFNGADQALRTAETAMPVRKVMEDGQLIILKNGVRYNAVGAAVR